MTLLPGWLDEARRTVPQWIRQISHADGPGRYRFAVDAYEPYDLDTSCMVENARLSIEGMPQRPERQAWVDYLLGMQRPEDGLLIDAGMERHIMAAGPVPTEEETFNVRRWTTRNGLTTVVELGWTPTTESRMGLKPRQEPEAGDGTSVE